MSKISPPYKIVLVLQDLEFGGTQRYALNLIQHLNRSLFIPELWILRGGSDMAPIAEKSGVRIRWFTKSKHVTPIAIARLFFHLAQNRPVFLYPLTVIPNIWARLFGSFFRIPVIVSSYRNLVAHQYESILWPLSTHIICNAFAIREKLIETHRTDVSRISVIPNGVDTDHFHPCYEKQSTLPTIIFAGRLVRQKQPQMLLKSFKIIQQIIPEARLLILGNGPMNNLLRSYIGQNNLEHKVTFVGGTTNVRKYLHKSMIFLLSSLYEGSPNIIIEAMACGLPVIATETSGIPEIIDHGVNGFMVPTGDFEAMAKYAVLLLGNDSLRAKMGTEARKRAITTHNLKTCVYQTEKVLLNHLPERFQ